MTHHKVDRFFSIVLVKLGPNKRDVQFGSFIVPKEFARSLGPMSDHQWYANQYSHLKNGPVLFVLFFRVFGR